jgi:hypothetical protein
MQNIFRILLFALKALFIFMLPITGSHSALMQLLEDVKMSHSSSSSSSSSIS